METTVIAARLPSDEVEAFRAQAARHGLTPSRAMQALVEGALLAERQRASELSADARG